MKPTKESEKLGKLIDHIVARYQEIESTLPLLSRELSHSERKALKVVASAGRIPIGGIGKALNLPASTTTWIVGGLVKRGIFQRTPDESDRRKVWVELAGKGEALARLIERISDRIASDLLLKLDQEKREIFVELVTAAIDRIEETGSLK